METSRHMSEATIAFPNHDQIRTMFGARDQYLRHVREKVGIDVVLRGDELRLQGTEDQIRRCLLYTSDAADE